MIITKANKSERSIVNWARNLYRRYEYEFENDEPINGGDAVESLVEFLHIVKANTPELKRRRAKRTLSPAAGASPAGCAKRTS